MIEVTTASVAPQSANLFNPFLLQNQAADANAYLVATTQKNIDIVKNYKNKFGEIDIIAKDGEEIVFVEVKTRTSGAFGTPFEQITKSKIHTLIKTAQFYKLLNPNLLMLEQRIRLELFLFPNRLLWPSQLPILMYLIYGVVSRYLGLIAVDLVSRYSGILERNYPVIPATRPSRARM